MKEWKIVHREELIGTYYVEAENEEGALNEFDRRNARGEIDYSDLEMVDSSNTAVDPDAPPVTEGVCRDFYYKLWRALEIAMKDESLSCHCNSIVVQLGKSIDSAEQYYDKSFDGWLDYFLAMNEKKGGGK